MESLDLEHVVVVVVMSSESAREPANDETFALEGAVAPQLS